MHGAMPPGPEAGGERTLPATSWRKMHGAMPPGPVLAEAVLDGMHALGCLDSRQARQLFQRVEEVIVPRLAEHGLEAERAWRERRAP